MEQMEIRLQKRIAENSDYSRRRAEDLIGEGKVTVNGKIVSELGTKVSPDDHILVDGNELTTLDKVYYIINKPTGVISTRSDEQGRRTVVDLIPEPFKIYPVGRLDFNTTGLLLITNDGALANGLMHPKKKIPKTYRAKLNGYKIIVDPSLKIYNDTRSSGLKHDESIKNLFKSLFSIRSSYNIKKEYKLFVFVNTAL
jgi:23S rRNA pseudouridine2605 synthase